MGKKLWQRDGATGEPDERVEAFTVGDDHLIDLHILADDCWASIAHAAALKRTGILSAAELEVRRAAWTVPAGKIRTGWLRRYAQLVTSANTGAVLEG